MDKIQEKIIYLGEYSIVYNITYITRLTSILEIKKLHFKSSILI